MRKVIVVLLIMLSAAIVSSGQPPDRFPPILATPAQAGGLMILQGGVPVVSGYTYTSTGFNGASRLYHTGNLTGIADTDTGLFSGWFRFTDGDASFRMLISAYDGGTNRRFSIAVTASDTLLIYCRDSSSTIVLQLANSTGTFTTSTGWFHILCSFDLSADKAYLYINGVSNIDIATEDTAGIVDYNMAGASPQWDINGVEDNSFRFTGLVSEYYFTNEYLDLSVEANRLKFRTADGKPENLGANGSTPTGTQPLIYLKNAYGTFGTNLGSGGNFSVNGDALTDGGANIP